MLYSRREGQRPSGNSRTRIEIPLISGDNGVSKEIKQRNVVANKCCHGLAIQLKFRFLSRHNKIKIYKTLIRPASVGIWVGNVAIKDRG
jgi:glutamate synthase domain-containing protein 1